MSTTRISKTMAEEIAKKLLEKKKDAINSNKKLLSDFATMVAKDSFKPEILTAFNKHRDYFHKVKEAYFYYHNAEKGTSAETDTITLIESIPSTHSGYRVRITIDHINYEKINLWLLQIEKLQKDYKSAFSIVVNTIINLRTPMQLKKNFPEAWDVLPKENNGTMLPMVNLDQVRSLIK